MQDIALGKGDRKKTAEGLVDELVSGGMNRKDAKAGIDATMSAVRSERQSQQQTIKRAATDEAKKGAGTAKVDATKGATVQTASAKNNLWILCADDTNGGKFSPTLAVSRTRATNSLICLNLARSVMAQTYLEFVRSWTMNTQKQWIFKHVESVGVLTASSFTKTIVEAEGLQTVKANAPVPFSAIDAIAGDESHFRTKDWPDEKETILKRVREHKSQGLSQPHFERYEHIICFVNVRSLGEDEECS